MNFTILTFIGDYENFIHVTAEIIILTLELIAILTIVGGCVKSLFSNQNKSSQY